MSRKRIVVIALGILATLSYLAFIAIVVIHDSLEYALWSILAGLLWLVSLVVLSVIWPKEDGNSNGGDTDCSPLEAELIRSGIEVDSDTLFDTYCYLAGQGADRNDVVYAVECYKTFLNKKIEG